MDQNSTRISDVVTGELYRDAMFQITNSFCGVKFEDDSGSGSDENSDDNSNSDENSVSEYSSESEYNTDSDEDPDLDDNKHYCPIGKIKQISKTSSDFTTILIECTLGSRIKLGTFVLLPYLASGIFRNKFSWIGHVVKTAGCNGDIDTLEARVPSHRFRCLENVNIGDKLYYEHLKECFLPLVEIPEDGIEIEKTSETGFHVGSAKRTSISVKRSDKKILARMTKPCQAIGFTERSGFKRHYCPLGQIIKLTKMPSESLILVEGYISPRNVFRHGWLQVFNIASGIFKDSFSSIGKINSYAEKIDGWEFEIKLKSDKLLENLKIGDIVYHVHYWECHVPIVNISQGGIQIRKAVQSVVAQVGSETGRSKNPKKATNPNWNARSQINSGAGMGSSQKETSETEFLSGILTKQIIKMASETSSRVRFETGLNRLHSVNRRSQVVSQPKPAEPTMNPNEGIGSQVDCQRGTSEIPKNDENSIENGGPQIFQERLSENPENTKNHHNGNSTSEVDFQFKIDPFKEERSEPEIMNGLSAINEIKTSIKAYSFIQRGIPNAFQVLKYSLLFFFIISLFYSFYCILLFYYVYYILWSAMEFSS
ncbi:uncharacterized protein LOC117173119 [Belonocnema kinseyi]|uniref:uncharacterized protein LOC117173119 n=1 Tax=Belonocnema kinseyi TaxID=2817044 RepID=UPI00143D5016|nr:uncharacterized protein LOC117173119 [Belonocnema kinseyi]